MAMKNLCGQEQGIENTKKQKIKFDAQLDTVVKE